MGHFAAVQTAAGIVALALALLRWRRPEARLLAALACVPQTMLPYEAVPLFLIPCGWVESVGLVALSYAMTWAVHDVPRSFVPRSLAFAWAVPLFLFLPAALMIVRRPNVGLLPAWIERHTARLPRWLRGSPE